MREQLLTNYLKYYHISFHLIISFYHSANPNNSINKSSYWNGQQNMQLYGNKSQMQQSTNGSIQNANNNSAFSSILNTSCASAVCKDLPVLHVRNLDYKISADEWKRILLENFRKHCKEVGIYDTYQTSSRENWVESPYWIFISHSII